MNNCLFLCGFNNFLELFFVFHSVALCAHPLLPGGNYTGLDNTTKREYDIGESIVPYCDEGFQPGESGALSTASRTCQEGHRWDGPNYRCERKCKLSFHSLRWCHTQTAWTRMRFRVARCLIRMKDIWHSDNISPFLHDLEVPLKCHSRGIQ